MFLFIYNVNYSEWVERWTCIYDVLLWWWYRRFKWCSFIILWEKSFSIFFDVQQGFSGFLFLLSLFEKWFQQLMKYDTIDLFNWKFVRIVRLFPSLFIHDINTRVYRVYWLDAILSPARLLWNFATFFTGMFKITVFPTYFTYHAVFFRECL